MQKINREEMLKYFQNFDALSHKFFNEKSERNRHELEEEITRLFYSHYQRNLGLSEAGEIFQTMDKVYHYGDEENAKEINLLEQAADKFLLQYVDIEGMHELFRPSFFYFEWMMHLEYKQERHDYSYYRDHYVHQIRNLYEMFLLLQEENLWRDCMEIYRLRSNIVANRMADSVEEQKQVLSRRGIELLKETFGDLDEWCYHYIIFATAIVTSLVHDIGYPVTFVKRNLKTLQDFLPLSHLFMGESDEIPRVKSLLNNSLLFETVESNEIIRRLRDGDHGAYSAIILLCQYYDNGRIFTLEPIKRMVIELSALVIYNHTLKYHFQSEKKYDRYQNVFVNNPLSYLFRLCDDMQEWERVYFEITGKTTFFICEKCKMPMIRKKNSAHKVGNAEKMYDYTCKCGNNGINTVWFPYRRMMNVAPFTELTIENSGEKIREEQKWILNLNCDKGAMLQLVKYNPDFAIQRLNGIRELREILREQRKFPFVYIYSFLSNNPMAIKTMILKEFLETSRLKSSLSVSLSCKEGYFLKNVRRIIGEIKERVDSCGEAERIYECFRKQSEHTWDNVDSTVVSMLKKSIQFYHFLYLFCKRVCNIDFASDNEKKEEYELKINYLFEGFAREIAKAWNIDDAEKAALIADCIACMYANVSAEYFYSNRNSFRCNLRIPLRRDTRELLKKYTRENDYIPSEEFTFDFYSDYFFYYSMDYFTGKKRLRLY